MSSLAALFDGTSEVGINLGTTPLAGLTSWTATAWFQTSATSNADGFRLLSVNTGNGGGGGCVCNSYDNSGSLLAGSDGITWGSGESAPINDGNWHFCAMVCNAGAVSIYLDGSTTACSVDSIGVWDVQSVIGNMLYDYPWAGTAAGWVGLIQEVQLYNAALDPASQISEIYNGGTLLASIPSDLVGCSTNAYHLNGDASDYVGSCPGAWSSFAAGFGSAASSNRRRRFMLQGAA